MGLFLHSFLNSSKHQTSKIKSWREITYTDGSAIQHKDGSPPLVGSGVFKAEQRHYSIIPTATIALQTKWEWTYKHHQQSITSRHTCCTPARAH
eukprot:1155566-Pelagomonas_calceolata.AAC.4